MYKRQCYLFDIQSNGKLTLNSGTLKVDVRKSINRWRRVIYCYAGGTVTINGGTPVSYTHLEDQVRAQLTQGRREYLDAAEPGSALLEQISEERYSTFKQLLGN